MRYILLLMLFTGITYGQTFDFACDTCDLTAFDSSVVYQSKGLLCANAIIETQFYHDGDTNKPHLGDMVYSSCDTDTPLTGWVLMNGRDVIEVEEGLVIDRDDDGCDPVEEFNTNRKFGLYRSGSSGMRFDFDPNMTAADAGVRVGQQLRIEYVTIGIIDRIDEIESIGQSGRMGFRVHISRTNSWSWNDSYDRISSSLPHVNITIRQGSDTVNRYFFYTLP